MNQFPPPERETENSDRNSRLTLLRRALYGFALLSVVGMVGGGWWLWRFIQRDLVPLIETNLKQTLGREIEIGQVKNISLTGVAFDSLSVPPTAEDRDNLSAESIQVNFSPLQVLLTRKLALDVTLIKPRVYIDQAKNGSWVETTINTGEDRENLIEIELKKINLRDGDVVLFPNKKPGVSQVPIRFTQFNGEGILQSENTGIDYQVNTLVANQGKVNIQGNTLFESQKTNLEIQTENFLAANLSRLLELPFAMQSGNINAKIGIKLDANQDNPAINGTAQLNQIIIQSSGIPKPVKNIQGKLNFQEQNIDFAGVEANYGQIPVRVNGSLNTQTGFNLAAQIKPVSIPQILKTANLQLPVPAKGLLGANLQVKGSIQQPQVIANIQTANNTQIDNIQFKNINSQIQIQNLKAPQLIIRKFAAIPTAGGQITGNGQVELAQSRRVDLDIKLANIPGNILAQAYNLPLPINIGRLNADSQITGRWGGDEPLKLVLQDLDLQPGLGGRITGNGQVELAQSGRVNVNIRAANLPGNALAQAYDLSLPINIGAVAANTQITGRLNGSNPLQLNLQKARIAPEIGGEIIANGNVELAQSGRINLNVRAANLPGDAIAKAYELQSPLKIGNIALNAQTRGTINNLTTTAQFRVPNATYPGQGKVVIRNQDNIRIENAAFQVAGGIVAATGQLTNQKWQASVNTRNIQLAQIPQIPDQFAGILNSKFQLSGITASFQPETIRASGQAQLQIADGTVNLNNINLEDGQWQANTNISQVSLASFTDQLRGRLNSNLRIAGTTKSPSLANLRARGTVGLSPGLEIQGLTSLQQPLTAQIQWDGKQLIIPQATSPGLRANGAIAINTQSTTPEITDINLRLQAKNYDLNNLPIATPFALQLAGNADLNTQIRGDLANLTVLGDVDLRQLAVNNLAFDPLLTGKFNYQSQQGGSFNLTGNNQDRIAVNVGANNQLISFFLRRDRAVATGTTQQDNLAIDFRQVPLQLAKNFLPKNQLTLQPIDGEISGNAVVNLTQPAATGNIAIAQPRLGQIRADKLASSFNFAEGVASVSQGSLSFDDSAKIAFSGQLDTQGDRPFQAEIDLTQVGIQRILDTFNLLQLSDFTGSSNPNVIKQGADRLQTIPVTLPDNMGIYRQLQRYSEIEALIAQQSPTEDNQTLPALAELQGFLNGKINLEGELANPLQTNLNFNLNGNNWQWGEYNIQQVVAQGGFNRGIFQIQPLRIQTETGSLAFSGQLGQELTGQLQIQDLPIDKLPLLPSQLPVDIQGDINAIANLGGSLGNPTAQGNVTLTNGRIQNRSLESAQLDFKLANARLNFDSLIAVNPTQPMTIKGSIPVPLPFTFIQPENQQIQIAAKVQNEGLSLLNLFTNQITWQEGQGQVNANISGTLQKPIFTGIASIDNAVIQTQALPQPLTNISGQIQLDSNLINVNNLTAQYNQGQITAIGTLPLENPQPTDNPLNLSLNNFTLNLPQLYQGEVTGNIAITGTALTPQIGGEITLTNGEISLDKAATAIANPSSPNPSTNPDTTTNLPVPELQFADLQLILSDDVRVTYQPLLSFNAKGDLNINGSLENPQPAGVIRLTGGQVNLFTTQFVLERGYPQTASFTPDSGLNPILDVRLSAIVPETTATRNLESPFSSEIEDVPTTTNLGRLRSVRIKARIEGSVENLDENLILTSEPRRSQAEIISLIGGSYTNLLGQENPGLGILTLAGGSLLSPLQGAISNLGETIGLRELRLFPTIVTDSQSESSVLGLAGEAVIDVSNDLSVSISRVFIGDEPFRYNLLYRFNDEILLRGSTSLDGESRTLVEYETRF